MKARLRISLFLWVSLLIPLSGAETFVSVDFESRKSEDAYRTENWGEDGFPTPKWGQGFDSGRVTVDESFPHGESKKSLRVMYPKGGFGPGETGAQTALILEPRAEYFISYWLRFGEGFSWDNEHHGGKLPGLASGNLCSGGQSCEGENGFTARLMWRTNGKAVLYLYHMDKPHKYGEDHAMLYPSGENVVFTPGVWFKITERVKINSGNNKDGEVQLWVNDESVLTVDGVRFVNNGDLIDTLMFSTFHGGADPDWAPEIDSYVNFDDFKVGTSFEAVR